MVDRFNGSRGMFKNSVNGNGSTACCSCGNSSCGNGGDCAVLSQKLKAIDFSLIDTVLYLDAYPDSKKALAYYHRLIKERKMTVEALSQSCNAPVTNYDNASEDTWYWVEKPWPWEPSAN